jgi:Reverse transcriptase (RNA-dependent DNA polymerase)
VGDTYSPTLLKNLPRVIVAVAVKLGLIVKPMDVKSAYLHGDIIVRVVIELPEIVYPDLFCRENVGVLTKVLYKLKQARLLSSERLSGVLVSMGFGHCEADLVCMLTNLGSVLGPFMSTIC